MSMRFGILGAARIARNSFVPGVRGSQQAQLSAGASRDPERARAFAQESGIPHTYASYSELLQDPDIDAVYNALPNSLHVEWTWPRPAPESTCFARSRWLPALPKRSEHVPPARPPVCC
jgi:predicted dehydrogenase